MSNEIEKTEKTIILKTSQGLNESNLMTLPFVSMKRKPEEVLVRKWIKGDKEVGLKVVGGEKGCPTMYDLDVLLALFRLMTKQMDNKYVLSGDNKVEFPKTINFSYRKLAKEMRLSSFGIAIKNRIESSIKTLNETTIYSSFSFRDGEEGKYVKTFKGEQSCRILKNFKSYSIEERKFNGEKLLCGKDIESNQSIEIDEFFYNNLCNNYFKIYDTNKYYSLKSNIAKKLLLILTQWSSGYEKYITMQTLYDYIGIDVTDKKSEYYYNNELKKALNDLKRVKFIDEYIFKTGEGVIFVFNKKRKEKYLSLDKYNNDAEVVARLREIGVEYDDINKFCQLDTMQYVAALLRYVDNRIETGTIADVRLFTLKGLPYGRYDVSKFMVEI